MPIYEFYCSACHAIYQFLSRRVTVSRTPSCPKCGRSGLDRRPSSFAISKGRPETAEGAATGLDDGRLEQAMGQLAGEADGLDENDPQSAARFMRRLYQTAGIEPGQGLTEALRRLESGEDPDAIEQDLGDVLEEDPLAGGGPEPRSARLRRRFLPPRVDPELHEL